jgi:agmatinase
MDLSLEPNLRDVGDLDLDGGRDFAHQIEQGVTALLEKDLRVIALGGDHAITYPIVKAHAKVHGAVNILHLDAHPDLYQEFEGNRYSHASPFARIMEDRLATRLVQLGIRTMNPHQHEQATRFGVEIIDAQKWSMNRDSYWPRLDFDGPLYLSLDIDVLDPAYAPGISHHEPGGLSTRDVIEIIDRLPIPLIGADIVELNPKRDVHGMTAMVAAKFLKEIAGQMLSVV